MHLRLLLGGQIGPGDLGPPLCVLFEGWDASGKGGAIKRLVGELDPRHVRVAQFAAPTHDEKRHHFLWRFWPVLPGWGGMAVLDRTWYGRVLVERVEGFASEEAWQRAYAGDRRPRDHARRRGHDRGQVLDAPLPRGAAPPVRVPPGRPLPGLEAHRGGLAQPGEAAGLRGGRRGHARAHRPSGRAWHVVAAEDKRWARVAVVRAVNEAIESALKARGIDPDPPLTAPT